MVYLKIEQHDGVLLIRPLPTINKRKSSSFQLDISAVKESLKNKEFETLWKEIKETVRF